ncbi:hypothetical protein H5410_036294, partial [Solanum commersonii]
LESNYGLMISDEVMQTEEFLLGQNLLSCYDFVEQSCEYIVKQLSNMQKLRLGICKSWLLFWVVKWTLPTKYLGLPLGAKNKELEVWSGVMEKCEKKLSMWKSQYLSTIIRGQIDSHQGEEVLSMARKETRRREFNNNISITVGNGLKNHFFHEVWIGEGSLRNSFPHLYTLNLQRNAKVSQVWSQHGWELLFRRALNDWEIGEVANLLEVLNSHLALSVRHDKPRCKLGVHSDIMLLES